MENGNEPPDTHPPTFIYVHHRTIMLLDLSLSPRPTSSWLRYLPDPAKPTFGQRGAYAAAYRAKMLHTRSKCTEDKPGGLSDSWSCPPTHVPWTSGSIGVTPDLTVKYETGGGWGNSRIHQLDAKGAPIESSCTRNQGAPCDPKVLGHAG